MAQDVLNLNEESFSQIIEALTQLSPELKEHFDGAVKRITALSGEWDDEDQTQLLEAIAGLKNELNAIDDAVAQLIAEARRKIEMIQARRNIQM